MADRMTPVRLASIAAPAVLPPAAPARYEPRIFPDSPFVEMTIDRVVEDHVVATHAGTTGTYAIGHLPAEIRAMLTPPSSVGVQLADTARRTILGLVSDQVIEDLHDDGPSACPLAVAAIRLFSLDPARSLREYAARAAMLGQVIGKEFGRDGVSLVYRGAERRLTVDVAADGWMLDGDTLLIPHLLPETLCAAAAGRPLGQIVEHRMLDGIDAVVTCAERSGQATSIGYRTRAVDMRTLEEMQGTTT